MEVKRQIEAFKERRIKALEESKATEMGPEVNSLMDANSVAGQSSKRKEAGWSFGDVTCER